MREFSFVRSQRSPAAQAKFDAEILDLRVDILRGLVIPLIALGWGGMGYGLAFSPQRPDWIVTILFGVVLVAGLTCVWAGWGGRPRLALVLCALSLWGVALAQIIVRPDAIGLVWLGAAGVLVMLLLGTAAGWAATAAASAALLWLSWQPQSRFSPNDLPGMITPLILLALLTHIVSRVLFQTLRWMSEGYALAHQQTDQLRDKSAELAGALKSLSQTSFALARANEQLEIMVRYAEDARRSKQEFAASISHELRTPLNLIIGFSDIIMSAPGTYNTRRLPAGLLADIHVIHQNAQHLLKLVNDILDLSQMDVAYMTITREPVRIDGFIQAALQDFAQLIESRGLKLEIEVDPDLPEIYADKTRIRQVLLNLVNNAIRFTDTGGITIRAQGSGVRRQESEDRSQRLESGDQRAGGEADTPSEVVISVTDTGVGIPPEDLQRIFEPFTKIDRSAKHQGGTGLGLTISKRFVELHGGRMWVESAPGKGSTFAFTLPVVPPPPDAPMQGALRDVRRQELGAVIVVERNPVLSRLLAHRLEGIHIRRLASTADLWALRDEELPEVVILNQPIGAPEEWQPQAPRAARWQRIPVMVCHLPDMLSLPAQAGADAAPHEAGADHTPGAPQPIRRFLIKPIARDQLYEALGEMLRAGGPDGPGQNGAEPVDTVRPDRAAPRQRRPARILIVEDDEEALRLLSRMLRSTPETFRCGYDAVIPVEMRSGEQAIEYLRALARPQTAEANPATHETTVALPPIDGILLDLKLGGAHGYEVLAELERHETLRRTPVCIVSGQELAGEALTSPSLTLARGTGLTARDLTQAIAALMQIALPGVTVTVR